MSLGMLDLPAFELDLREYFGEHAVQLRVVLDEVGLIWVTGGTCSSCATPSDAAGLEGLIGERIRSEAMAHGEYSAGACVAGPTLRGPKWWTTLPR